MGKRSIFVDALGTPKMDLRGRPKCALCGIRLTLKNWCLSTGHPSDNRSDVKHYCENCYLTPEALGFET